MTTLSSVDSFSTHRATVVSPCGTPHRVLVRRAQPGGGGHGEGWWVTSYGARFDAITGASGFPDGPQLDPSSVTPRRNATKGR